MIPENVISCPYCGSTRHRVDKEDPGLPVKILECLECGTKFPVKYG